MKLNRKRKSCDETGKGKTPEEDRAPQDDNKKDNKVKVLNTLNEAPKGSQVTYLAWIDLPEEFIQAIATEDVDIPNRKSFAIRLNATKIGQAKSIEKFLNKMARLQSIIPFATIRYIAIIIPPHLVEKGFTGKQGEQGMHLANMEDHVMGEWFNLTIVQREDVVARFLRLGCLRFDGQTSSPQLNINGTIAGTRGKVYFARFDWDEHDLKIITTLQQNVAHQSTCMKMLSVKIGSGKVIIRGGDVDSDDDADSDDEEQIVDTKWRGSQFVTFTSQLTRTTVKAFSCNGMFREERKLHNQNHDDGKWVESGEWFNLNDAEVTAQIPQNRRVIETTWERRRSGRRSCYYDDEVYVWVNLGIIEEWEMQDWTGEGKIHHREE